MDPLLTGLLASVLAAAWTLRSSRRSGPALACLAVSAAACAIQSEFIPRGPGAIPLGFGAHAFFLACPLMLGFLAALLHPRRNAS